MKTKEEEKEKIYYANSLYEIMSKDEKLYYLRSTRDRNLIIHVPVNSTLLKQYTKEE